MPKYEMISRSISIECVNAWLMELGHCVYILVNRKNRRAYIGQTSNIKRRTKEHMGPEKFIEKYKLDIAYIIRPKKTVEGVAEGFTGTHAKHFEWLLVRLMKADKKFKICTSKTEKQRYHSMNNFEKVFDEEIWPMMAGNDLVEQRDFSTVISSGTYKYSPDVPLNKVQQKALDAAVNVLISDEIKDEGLKKQRVVLVNGDAGTGKTVFATSLLHYLKTNEGFKRKYRKAHRLEEGKEIKVALVYSQPSMRDYIAKAVGVHEGLSSKDIIAPVHVAKSKEEYHILICDEAHRLRRNKGLGLYGGNFKKANEQAGFADLEIEEQNELNWILKKSRHQIIIYDDKQTVLARDIGKRSFEKAVGISDVEFMYQIRPITLNEQMRIQAGDKFIPYIRDIFSGEPSLKKRSFKNYEFMLFDKLAHMVDLICEKEELEEVSRLCSGYAWEWGKDENGKNSLFEVDGVKLRWNDANSGTGGWLDDKSKKDEVGSIYTLAGLDLNYAGVIIGPDLTFKNGKVEINKEHIFDKNVKKDVKAMEDYIINAYGVLMTRGIKGTFVYVYDKNLRNYFRKFIQISVRDAGD